MYPPSTVQFSQPMPVVNAACCSDPRMRCEKCAAAALNERGHTLNERNDPMEPHRSFDDDPLIPPTINWEEEKKEKARKQPVRNIRPDTEEDDDLLPLPKCVGL